MAIRRIPARILHLKTRHFDTPFALSASAFFVSGVCALVYQVVWQRILALGSGAGIYSIATIVAAFMAGLGIGSHLGGHLSARLTRSRALVAFALVEGGIALFGALSPFLFYDLLYRRATFLYASPWSTVAAHFASLLVPTTLMGMSLPFLVRALVRSAPNASRRVAVVYGINVLGAATGAAVGPWFLMRHLGLDGALFAAAAGNILAAVTAVLAWRTTKTMPVRNRSRASRSPSRAAALVWCWAAALWPHGLCRPRPRDPVVPRHERRGQVHELHLRNGARPLSRWARVSGVWWGPYSPTA